MQWACRCFLLFKRFYVLFKDAKLNDLPVSELFLLSDPDIKKLIERNSPEFNLLTDEMIIQFDDIFREFIEFLQKCNDARWKCINATQIFALFYKFCDKSKITNIILSHMPYLSREGNIKSKKILWGSKDDREPRRKYFDKCIAQINSITEHALPLDDRNITKALKKQVWAKCVNNMCEICKDEIIESEFEAGHIKARALGGQTELDNLIPMCFACNRCMGTKNAYDYKKDTYPEHCLEIEEAI